MSSLLVCWFGLGWGESVVVVAIALGMFGGLPRLFTRQDHLAIGV